MKSRTIDGKKFINIYSNVNQVNFRAFQEYYEPFLDNITSLFVFNILFSKWIFLNFWIHDLMNSIHIISLNLFLIFLDFVFLSTFPLINSNLVDHFYQPSYSQQIYCYLSDWHYSILYIVIPWNVMIDWLDDSHKIGCFIAHFLDGIFYCAISYGLFNLLKCFYFFIPILLN